MHPEASQEKIYNYSGLEDLPLDQDIPRERLHALLDGGVHCLPLQLCLFPGSLRVGKPHTGRSCHNRLNLERVTVLLGADQAQVW